MKLTFLGATEEVSGSQYLLEHQSFKILIDCGIDYNSPNQAFEFSTEELNYVFITHAHTDHAGKLFQLFRSGFKGKIFASAPTIELCKTLIQESIHIQYSRLSLSEQKKRVAEYMSYFIAVPLNQRIEVESTIQFEFYASGHILGAVSICLSWKEENETKVICFSGDIGKQNDPLHPIQAIDKNINYLVCESTYGNKLHEEHSLEEELETHIKSTCIEKKGKLIIPAFSIGRTQQLLYALHKLYVKNRLFQLPVVIDSNSAYQASRVYEKYTDWLKPEIQIFKNEFKQITHFDSILYLKTAFQFNKIKSFHSPSIILTSSGMIVGGRVLKHLGLHLQNNANTLLMVGYAAPGTLAHQLLLDKASVEINKEKNKIKADIYKTDVFSAHADQKELIDFIHQFNKPSLKCIFLTHGSEVSKSILKEKINAQIQKEVLTPIYKEAFIL